MTAPVAAVGDTAEMTREVTAADIEKFTEISGDRNPLHYDEEAARCLPLRRDRRPGRRHQRDPERGRRREAAGPGTVFLNVSWDFKAPVRPGDTITGRVEVTAARDDKPIATLKTQVVRGDGTVVLDGTAVTYTMDLG